MQSFPPEGAAVVIGASGGIGGALAAQLRADPAFTAVHALARSFTGDGHIDVTEEPSIAAAAARIGPPLRLVIVATGALQGPGFAQPEKTYRAIDPVALMESFRLNTVGPALVAKHLLPLMAPRGRTVFVALSARVGSIGDNRAGGWHAYRASKAALNMILRNLAIETSRRNPEAICVGLHPGTVDTGLSRPFQRGLPDGQVFSAETSAHHLLAVIDGLGPADSGTVLAWDGKTIPP
ncbi:MAG: SDR family NAD(P)-dependent oxidoreductase [Proteobacteria bacterium]|nr:SDR family NAD(P)-dependent oxidoreductase [Pseudomonadota bacterium]